MSIAGILSSNLFSSGVQDRQNTQKSQNSPSNFQQIKAEFQQLGQDLQSGNLKQAQSDYATLSQNIPGLSQTSATAAPTASSGTPSTAANPTTGTNTLAQQFAQLGQDLQLGNLQAAQQDFTNLQQAAQQSTPQVAGQHGHRHHHHAAPGLQSASATSSSQQSEISSTFGALGQDLQTGNLSGAQSAFATLSNDLQQIGGFITAGSSATTATAAPAATGGVNISA